MNSNLDNQIHNSFLDWKKNLQNIYPDSELQIDLFTKHNILILAIIIVFELYKNTIENENSKFSTPKDKNSTENSHNTENELKIYKKKYFNTLKIINIPEYFYWIVENRIIFDEIQDFLNSTEDYTIKSGDLFSTFYQDLIVNTTRHSRGEFYTHSALARLMCDNAYKFGSSVLDPSCGSGTFLIEIAKKIFNSKNNNKSKISAFSKICGIDINPISCAMATTNLLMINPLILKFNQQPAVINDNTLFPHLFHEKSHILQNYFDLVIGNPPWLVLNRIPSNFEKKRIKELGYRYGILIGGKLATSTELTTIFLYKALNDFLKPQGTLFFVVPASLANAAQHNLFRQFVGLKNIEFWAFDQDAFRIHNLCIKGISGFEAFDQRINVIWKLFHCEIDGININTNLISTQSYYPSSISLNNKSINVNTFTFVENEKIPISNLFVGRLIPKSAINNKKSKLNSPNISKKQIFFDQTPSPYKTKFRQGASLVPRNLLFVDIIDNELEIKSKKFKIIPSKSIRSKKYSTWEFKAFEEQKIESDYIFTIVKSTGLIPFHYHEYYNAFLPIQILKDQIEVKEPILPLAMEHYKLINELYKQNKKTDAKITNLFDRINYGKALSDSSQLLIPKVIYAGIGSIVKATIIEKSAFVDTSLYYFIPRSINEAYYLLGYLNSPSLTNHIKLIGSTGAGGSLRNIHKHPFNFSLEDYSEGNKLHQSIVEKAQKLEKLVQEIIQELIVQNPEIQTKTKILQRKLISHIKYKKLLNELDELIQKNMEKNKKME